MEQIREGVAVNVVSHPVFVVGSLVYLPQKCPRIRNQTDLVTSVGLFMALKTYFRWVRFKRHVEGVGGQLLDFT